MRMLIAAVAMVVVTVASADQTNQLTVLKQVLDTQEQNILVQYGKSLDVVMTDLKKVGNLDDYLTVAAEQKRFKEAKTVPLPTHAKPPFRATSESYHRAMASLLEKYIAALDDLIKKEMAADKIESAKLVKAEKDRAAFLLADTQSELPAKTTTEEPKTNGSEKPVAPTVVPTFKPKTHVDETRGWAGMEPKNNVYTFKLDSVGRKTTFRFWASGDIGTGTSGQVLLTGPDGKEQIVRQWQPSDFKIAANTVSSYRKLTPISCDVSSYVKQPGDYHFGFRWGGSPVGLAILRVELELH